MFALRILIKNHLKTSNEYKKAIKDALKEGQSFEYKHGLDFLLGLYKAMLLQKQKFQSLRNKPKYEAALKGHIFNTVRLEDAARSNRIEEAEYPKLETAKQKYFEKLSQEQLKGKLYSEVDECKYDESIQESPFTFNEELQLLEDLRLWQNACFCSERYCACQICVLEHLYISLLCDFIRKCNKPFLHKWKVTEMAKLQLLYDFDLRHSDIP